jgi:hypothetical protein
MGQKHVQIKIKIPTAHFDSHRSAAEPADLVHKKGASPKRLAPFLWKEK